MARVIPLISSDTAGPLGAIHLPRLWAKLTLHNAGMLPDDYDSCGAGFDQMTIDGLGLDRQRVIDFVRTRKPSYVEFETWVLTENGGAIAPEKIRAHNAALRAYHHGDELAAGMRKASGVKSDAIKDAVTLNTLEDLDRLHAQAKAGA
jgi:hypothetical protein